MSNNINHIIKDKPQRLVLNISQWISLVLMSTLLMPFPQLAQADGLEEVIVTAQKREENLQDVPIAISALTASTIEKEDIHDLTDVATRVPGLTFSPFSPGQNIVSLRGVSSNDDGAGTDNSVAVYIDGVYMGRVSNVNPDMFDVQGIEVLRGPQGTLYGKNTIGGAIVVRSTKPDTEEFHMKLKANIGNYKRKDFAGLVTGPIADNWAGKLSFSSRNRDGWVNNVLSDQEERDNDSQSIRGQLLFSGEKAEILFSADYHILDVKDMGRIPLTQGHGGLGSIVDAYETRCGVGSSPDCATNIIDGFAKREALGGSIHIDYDLGFSDFTSITAIRKSDIHWLMDAVGVPPGVPGVFPGLGDEIKDKSEQFSQEFRLTGNVDKYLQGKYVLGLWYLHEKTDRTEVFDFVPAGVVDSQYTQVNKTNSYAVFGQYDWDITDRWALSVGGRYSYEKKSIVNDAIAGTPPIIGADFSARETADWQAFTPKAVLSFRPTDYMNTYFSITKGFKSGGFAAAPTTIQDTQPLKQEEALNYEFGLKADLLNNTLRINSAVFFTKYKDLQYQSFGPRPGVTEFGIFRTTNLGGAEALGFELEYIWLPLDNLTLSGSYGYLDSEYTDAVIENSGFSVQTGQDMIRAPKHKYLINGEYVFRQLGSLPGLLTLSANYRYTGSQRGELEPYAIQPSFGLIDSRLAWTDPKEQFEVALWIKNMADEEYVTHIYTIGSEVIGVHGDPRFYGASLTWNY